MKLINRLLLLLHIHYKLVSCPKSINYLGDEYILPLRVKGGLAYNMITDAKGKSFCWQPIDDEKINLLVRAINTATYNPESGKY